MSDLRERYRVILAHAWRERRQTDTSARLVHELAFLPANLELTETPPHPAPLWAARLLMGAALIVVLIGAFGELDIVAVAPGQLIPNANVKVIQPAVTGVVRKILVQNGERVTAGQLLVELDPTQATADAHKAKTSKIDAQLALARAQALLTALDRNSEPKIAQIVGATLERQSDTQSLAEGSMREYRHKLASLHAELHKREAELDSTREEIAKLKQTAPLARQEASDYKELARHNYVATHEYLDKEKAAIEQTHELAAQESHVRELEAGIDEQRRTIDTTVATFRREQWEALNKAEQDAAQTREEETKADARQSLMQIESPVAGIVQQLNVHTVGGVVSSAQALMEIVPDDTLEVEARISNKDIGFVNPGQSAMVKLATFPYARFGYLTGKIIKVSNDASSDKKLGLVFLARIQIPSNRFRADGKWINLAPGMEVTLEVRTGTQKVWQYFLSPLIQTGKESLRER
ncbi:MAG TPA: HlyD family type I secretion periplasmic adaptor subunit [Steroidobacteraceae bacterium]|jgi:hemolysin D